MPVGPDPLRTRWRGRWQREVEDRDRLPAYPADADGGDSAIHEVNTFHGHLYTQDGQPGSQDRPGSVAPGVMRSS